MLERPGTLVSEAGGGQTRRSERLPVLVIVHQKRSKTGHVGRWFRDNGYPLDIRLPRYGDPLPETLEAHSGAVIFGGPMSATDGEDYVKREIDWIDVPLREEKPFLGICLGGQMLALKLGGEVEFDADGYAEIGYHQLKPTDEGKRLFDWPEHVYHWHREGFTVPDGAVLLAQSERFENQAIRVGPRAYGLQFHPEIDQFLVNSWTTRAAYRLVLPGAKPRRHHLRSHMLYGPDQRRWLGDLLASMMDQPAR